MKKFLVMVAMLFTMGVHAFAEDNEATNVANVEKYELKINHRRLACVLDVSSEQMEMYNEILSEFERDMLFASCMGTEEGSNRIVANAVEKNVKHMHYVLTDKQYKQYLMLLNLTLNHRGFNIGNGDND